ncbi:MAG: rRNA pseudouridine synthase, partial [Chloroflexi bacterium]|nr:rRNA pseudouridine synthase [Chloroflexota bacterium]
VTVDGEVAHLGDRVDVATVRIALDGVPIGARSALVHFALHKPLGVTSTVRDPHARRTVIDLVPPDLRAARIYPVGRLDLDSEGLLLLTNDGAWSDAVLHPRHGVEREYAVGVERELTGEAVLALRTGIALEEGIATVVHIRPQTAVETRRLHELLDPRPARLHWYRVTLAQGWKRQIRRMLASVGTPVVRLVRVRIGSIRLEGLPTGRLRPLTAPEVRSLASAGRAIGGAAER